MSVVPNLTFASFALFFAACTPPDDEAGDTGPGADSDTGAPVIDSGTSDSGAGDSGAGDSGTDDTDDTDDTADARLGESQLGIGVFHDPAWVSQIGSTGDDDALNIHVGSGEVLLAGETSGSWFADFSDACSATGEDDEGDDCNDAFAMNLSTGNGVQFGRLQSDMAKMIVPYDGAVYVAGKYREDADHNYQNDGFLQRYTPDFSTLEWEIALTAEGKVDEFLGLAVDEDVYSCGGSAAQIGEDEVSGDEDMFLMRTALDGSRSDTYQFGSSSFEELMGMSVDSQGAYAAGQTSGWLDDADGENFGLEDAFLIVTDRTLGKVCKVQFGTAKKDVAQTALVVGDFVYVVGYTEAAINREFADGSACNQDDAAPDDYRTDAFVAKYDKECNHVWSRTFGGPDGDAASYIASDGDALFVVGIYGTQADAHSGTAASTHAFLRSYDVDGTVTGEILFDSSQLGVAGTDIGQSVGVDDGYVHVVGGTEGTLGTGPGRGGKDIFYAKIPKASVVGNVAFTGDGCP